MAETQKEKLMRVLGCTPEEAEDIIETDKIIDKGGRTKYDLDPEKEKQAKQFARTRTVYNFDTSNRKRKENPTKEGIITELHEFLSNSSEYDIKNAVIVNKQGEISFEIGGISFGLKLTQHRKKK